MTESQPSPYIDRPALHLIYASAELPNLKQDLLNTACMANQAPITLNMTQGAPGTCLGRATFGEHELYVAGLNMPLPRPLIDQTVMISPWGPQTKAALRQHRTHLSLVYKGGNLDPVEQMIALYHLACALNNEDLLGVINPNAWTAHPVADFLSPDMIASYRTEIPFNLWFGYVRFYSDDPAFWLVTKGHHIFDVPDLAYQVHPDENPQAIIDLFINVFYYLYEQDVVVTAGDTLAVAGFRQQLVFSEVTELVDVLMGPAGTLVLAQSDQSAASAAS